MGSRRLMNRSLSGDGRYYHGANDFTSQNSRSGCRSYLNSVRPESSYTGHRFSQSKPSRSTLSSVMAQLTEETQPTFDSTLKSKAVSEASNVKFICMVSGHPTPEVTWYKDDVQLDRYCSLPKYEILRDGKNHTLHIYNCTLEDAAIYQASAQNSRGIVSCSGVLEVGTMNEYKIHQNYFAKLKQRNESRRREQEEPRKTDKENVPEALRMSSPERTQRKRRSPMEANPSFGAASSLEEKEELNAVSQTSAVEDRLGSPVPESESAPVHSLSEAEMITEGSQGLTYIHDTAHMASTKQTAKDHYAKKKLKISTAAADRSKENSQTESKEVTEMEMRDEMRGTSIEKMEVQKTKVIKNIKDDTKQTVKASKSAAELKRTQVAQKTIATQRRPALKVAMATQTDVVKDTKQTDSSDKQNSVGKSGSNINLNAQTTINALNQKTENCNPSSPDNKLMDLDDNKTKPAAGGCVRILPHSCGVGDVNADTGDRNVSTHSPRSSAGGDTHIEPMESAICGSISSSERKVVMELNQQPPLTRDVTLCVTNSELESRHLASQREKERARDQSMRLTINSTFESTQQGDKKSSVHVSHPLQDGQVTTAMNSSLGENTLTKMSEKDHTDGNLMIKTASDKPEGKIKSVATSLIGKELMGISVDKNKECISENVQVQKNISKEKSTASSMHSVSIVTEFVQIGNLTSMSDVLQSQTTNESSIAKALLNHSKDLTFQRDDHVAKDNVSKMDIQEQGSSNLRTSEVPKATHYQKETFSAKMEDQHSSTSKTSTIAARDNDPTSSHIDRSTFLSQHSKTLPSKFTIPAIYITDVDSTSPNIKTENIYLSPISNSENVTSCTESNVSNGNTVSQIGHTFDHTDNTSKTAATTKSEGLSDVDLSLHSQSSEVKPPQQTPQNQEKITHIQGLKNVASDFTGPNENGMSHCNAEKSTKANESDKCLTSLAKTDPDLKTETDSFIKQLKSAAIDLEKSDQNSTSVVLNATPHRDSKGRNNNWQAQTEVIQGESVLPYRNNNISPFSPSSEVTTLKTTDAQTPSLISQPASPLHSVSNSPSLEKHSPGLTRKSITADLAKPKGNDNIKTKPSERDKENQFKVPQVIRKIRPEVFDTSGHVKLWCQFYNIVSDSTIRWYKDDVEIAELKRSAGDETQVCLAIVQMYKRDCGVYKCVITNEYGQDSTEYLLITEILSNMFPREEHQEVGEEIEMTPLIFSKGLADAGCWGSKFYGRVTTEEAMVGSGCEHKTRRLRVIYGLDPVFESGSSCFMKVRSPIAYESREETVLAEKNLQITKQDCRIQNMAREYLKIFATETREIESFGSALEIIPLYFMYRPASTVPYATVEAELKGVYLRYCGLDHTGSLIFNNKSDVAQKCSSLQHWIYQWTNGNVLLSRLEGVDTILTNIGVVTKSQGYQGFPCDANPKIFEQFQTQHQCNYFCGLLNLKPPKVPEILQTARYRGSSSPQTQRKGSKSPKVSRKPNPQNST